MNIPLESVVLRQPFCFRENRFLAAHRYRPSLMVGDGTKIAGPKAAPIVRNGKLHLLDSRDAALLFIGGMVHTLIGQRVDPVKLLSGQGRHRRILHHNLVPVALNHGFSPHRVMLILLLAAGNGVIPFRGTYPLKAGAFYRRARLIILGFHRVADASDVPQRANR